MTPEQLSNYITFWRRWITLLLEVDKETDYLRAQWDALDLNNVLTDEHFVGANAGVTKEQFVNAITNTKTITDGISGGVATNLFRMKEG